MRWHTLVWASLVGCAVPTKPPGEHEAALEAFCTADVAGTERDVEADYLPHVVQCENGAAAFEALKAQAVAARSYLYYVLERRASIGDGQGDQVYSCGKTPGPEHVEAVIATSGEVLRYQGTQVAAFYVAGARNQIPPECRGSTDDPTGTEKYVTYNEGLSGDEVMQTSLGFVDPANHANRGCLSQNGSDCLADAGRGYDEILRFYYGADIEIVRASGPCVAPPDDGSDSGGGPGAGGDVAGGCAVAGAAVPRAPTSNPGSLASVVALGVAAVALRFRGHPSRHCRPEE